MANEITLQLALSATKNGTTFAESLAQSIDMAGDEMIKNVQDVGTSCEALLMGDVTTVGYVLFRNLDDTNYVELSSDNANANKIAKLLPGMVALIPTGTATIYGTAHTAGVKLVVLAIEL